MCGEQLRWHDIHDAARMRGRAGRQHWRHVSVVRSLAAAFAVAQDDNREIVSSTRGKSRFLLAPFGRASEMTTGPLGCVLFRHLLLTGCDRTVPVYVASEVHYCRDGQEAGDRPYKKSVI